MSSRENTSLTDIKPKKRLLRHISEDSSHPSSFTRGTEKLQADRKFLEKSPRSHRRFDLTLLSQRTKGSTLNNLI